MAQTIYTFLDNENETDQNSRTHIFGFHEEHSESLSSITPSLSYSSSELIHKTVPSSCTIMSIYCQSLNAKLYPKSVIDGYFCRIKEPNSYSLYPRNMVRNH